MGGLSWSWKPLRRLTWKAWSFPGEILDYAEEDIGGPEGAEALLRALKHNPQHELARWLLHDTRLEEIHQQLEAPPAEQTGSMGWKREQILRRLVETLIGRLNQILRHKTGARATDGPGPAILSGVTGQRGLIVRSLRQWPAARRLIERHDTRRALDAFLDKLTASRPAAGEEGPEARAPRAGFGVDLWHYLTAGSRKLNGLDGLLEGIRPLERATEAARADAETAALEAAVAARAATEGMFRLRCRQLICFWGGIAGFSLVGLGLTWSIWNDTFKLEGGEPFSLTSGTSAWPAQIVRLMILGLAIGFIFSLSHRIREAFLVLTRAFRFSLSWGGGLELSNRVCARGIWHDYRTESRFRRRVPFVGAMLVAYLGLLTVTYLAFGEEVLHPVRGPVVSLWNNILLPASVIASLLLALLTVDAACQCREFIEKLSAGPTQYPEATRRHFSREMGRIDEEYLDEWIDLQLIAELTERIGRLVYYPAALVLLMIMARNNWWDGWSWPVSLLIIFILNFILALASVIILQRAAKDAKHKAELSLTAKVKKLRAEAEPSVAQNNAAQAEKLLEEVRALDRGAFVPFWENPVVGAIFLSSGGTTMLQLVIWFMAR